MRLLFLVAWFAVGCSSFSLPTNVAFSDGVRHRMNRSTFLKIVVVVLPTSMLLPSVAEAKEVIPVTPTYREAIEMLQSQRLACDDIQYVISRGSLDEAGFKVQQLNAQLTAAGKVVLNTYQARSSASTSDPVSVVRFLKCQEKFTLLLELCTECSERIGKALRGKVALTAAQIQILDSLRDTVHAYDDFLLEIARMDAITKRAN